MKIVDCIWELANLDCRVAEISVDTDEKIDETALNEVERNYDYVVVKVESGSMQSQLCLCKRDYVLAETQLSMRKAKRDWNLTQDPFASRMMTSLSSELIEDEASLEELLSKITSGMFSTDRIYLDPQFGPEYGLRRYKNWIRTEWKKGSLLHKHMYDGRYVGFSLCKLVDKELKCFLVGIFEEYQKKRLGFVVPLVPEIIGTIPYKWYTAKISSNNMPVYRMYQWQSYEIAKFEYVFVKHINHA